MKTQELRIGNLVSIYNKREVKILSLIDSDTRIVAFEGFNLWDLDKTYPIPLTEEWLVKLGAKKFDGGFIIDRFRLIYKSAYGYYYVIDKYTNVYFSKVEFVHEWQNLFFAMNGQELILKPTT